jgi:hypothetical protein
MSKSSIFTVHHRLTGVLESGSDMQLLHVAFFFANELLATTEVFNTPQARVFSGFFLRALRAESRAARCCTLSHKIRSWITRRRGCSRTYR